MSLMEPNHFSVSVDDRLSELCTRAASFSFGRFVVEAYDCKSDCDQCCDDDLDNNSLS